jgi:hypothetical protein
MRSEAGHKISLLPAEAFRDWDAGGMGLPLGGRTPGDIFTVDLGRQAIEPCWCCRSKMDLFVDVADKVIGLALLSSGTHTQQAYVG